MLQIIAIALSLIVPTAMLADLTDYLPPDNTPPGWKKDGDAAMYTAGNISGAVDNAAPFTANGIDQLAVQYYRKGGKEVRVELFQFNNRGGAEGAFSQLSSGKPVETDLGEGTVIEPTMLMFYLNNYLVRITAGQGDEEISQTMAALGMTLWSYLE
jgi:hypothetical protein